MFTTESALVKLWEEAVREGDYTREQVPKLSNLQECVYTLLDSDVNAA